MNDTFSIEKTLYRQNLIEEAIEVVSFSQKNLGNSSRQVNEESEKAANRLVKLKQEQLLFSPVLDVTRIHQKKIENFGIKLSQYLQEKYHNNNFYYLKVPITLFPKSGWAFTRLECWLHFFPSNNASTSYPIIHDLFPSDTWTEILRFTSNLKVGLNGTLNFSLSSDQLADILSKAGPETKAQLSANIGAGGDLVVGPFSYNILRPDIRSRGRGNVECFWRLDGKKYVDEEDISLELVLMVPKDLKDTINVQGEVRASHEFQILSADIKDWKSLFSKPLHHFFEQGAPLSQEMDWVIQLP